MSIHHPGSIGRLPDVDVREDAFPKLTDVTERFNQLSEAQTMSIINSHPWDIPCDENTWLRGREKISLHGTEYFDLATEEEKRQLSIQEMGTWWTGFLVFENMVTEYYMKLVNDGCFAGFPTVVEYMHHFCREEINHAMVFQKAMAHFNIEPFPRLENFNLTDTYAPWEQGELPIFNVYLTLIVEWVADLYQRIDLGPETHPLAHAVVREHQKEEARHIAWGQQMVVSLMKDQESCAPDIQQITPGFMRSFLDTAVTNFECYDRVGFSHPAFQDHEKLCWAVIRNDSRKQIHQQLMKPVFDYWLDSGIYNPDMHELWENADFAEDVDAAKERRAKREERKGS